MSKCGAIVFSSGLRQRVQKLWCVNDRGLILSGVSDASAWDSRLIVYLASCGDDSIGLKRARRQR